MNKALAEIVAGLIPGKMRRNRYRGLLRYGVFNALRLKKRLRGRTPDPRDYLALCAIAKDEGPYFVEWLEWHISQGVERFYIYDNGSSDDTRSILEPYIESGIVEYTFWPGYRMQIAAYDDCIERHRFDARWIAFIDLDEFIVPQKDPTLRAFLSRFEDFAAVEINWLIYGSSGARKKENGPVMERFRMHSRPEHPLNRMVKSIVDPKRVYVMNGCHESSRICGEAADSHGNAVRRHFKEREALHDVIRINHYAVRSFEEFVEKQARGRASGRQKSVPTEYFAQYDLNDIDEAQSGQISA